MRELLAAERPELSPAQLDEIFDPSHFVRYADEIVGRLDAIA
jgi:adenylosuccinate lyase